MKTLYFECNMGAAGDMLTAALLELVTDRNKTVEKLNSLGIPGVVFSAETSVKCGITGTHVSVKINGEEEHSHDVHEHHHEEHHHHEHEHEHNHKEHHHHEHHHHASMNDIENIINTLNVSEKVKSDAIAVYRLIAEAESHAHGCPANEIHFHEVGTMDAVADVVAVCMLIEEISPDKIISSPVHTGSGNVKCAHGILPVPAPATTFILKDVPIYGGSVKGELCTPTGAALLKHFSESFGDMPVIRTEKTGYGMGTKDFEHANCVRAILGNTSDERDTVCELRCNVDDMTPEAVGFAVDMIMNDGALDVFTVSVGMKKNRPGIMITVLCRMDDKEKIVNSVFRYTSTIGIRENICSRYVLTRTEFEKETKYGKVRVKRSSGYGVVREKAEYDDLAEIARKNNISLQEIMEK